VVPVPGDTPGSPSAGPPALSKLRRRRSTGAELGADRSRRPDGVPFASGPDRGPAGPGGTLDFFTPRSGEAPRRRPAPIPDDPFRPGQPADGGLGRRGPQPGPTAGPRSPQPVQPPPPAPPTPVRTTPPPVAPPFDGAPPKGAPGNGRVPQQRSGDRPGGGPSFGARPIGEQPYGTQPFTAFGPPPEQDDPRGRRQNNGPRGDVPKKDADYVDWVSGLGDR
jgi:hypothetical protein